VDSRFLRSTDIIDWHQLDVLARARSLAKGFSDPSAIAKRCYEWVRDEIRHSTDHRLQVVTCAASEVLREGSGFCYAKSHLLAALLRANGLPAALCYQRLSTNEDGTRFCLHGLNAVYLPGIGWYRVDPRGNRADINAQFVPPVERLAFALTLEGEVDLPDNFWDPLPVVVDALRRHTVVDTLAEDLPDFRVEIQP
jgi:transglutaminase-like putative cysteine protease